jgi:hypothetical protein
MTIFSRTGLEPGTKVALVLAVGREGPGSEGVSWRSLNLAPIRIESQSLA